MGKMAAQTPTAEAAGAGFGWNPTCCRTPMPPEGIMPVTSTSVTSMAKTASIERRRDESRSVSPANPMVMRKASPTEIAAAWATVRL